MEVQECVRASRERARPAFPQLGQLAEPHQQRLDVIQVVLRRVSHGLSMTKDAHRCELLPTRSGTIAVMPTPVVFSWSAGKDSAFGLWTLLHDPAYEVRALLTTITDGYDRVSISGVREELLDRQAAALQLPVIKVRIPPACTNDIYEQRMAATLAAESFDGIDHIAFADLFLADVRAYREDSLARAGKHGVFPLWGRDTRQLAKEMVVAGFRATVVCVDPRVLDPSFAGREFDGAFSADLPDGVDPCGENGEFHTFVWAAPMFRNPIPCRTGEVVVRDGFVFCDVIPT